ncbi:MAG: alanine--tRNA ligase-related protein [Promethearchaeota archaeon]
MINGYWEDAYTKEFTTRIAAINVNKIILNETFFYPAGGNQPGDIGILKSIDGTKSALIIDTRYENGDVIHILQKDSPFQENEEVKGILNWEQRYGNMRAHSSQHVLSSILFSQYGLRTVKALIQPHDVTIYLSNSISPSDLKQSLLVALEICCEPTKSYQVKTHILPREEALAKYGDQIRGEIPDKGSLRLVQIGSKDITCCSGTHVKNTNEIGPISVVSFKNSEIRYLTGPAAMDGIVTNSLEILQIRQLLSGSSGSLTTHFRRLKEDREQKKTQLEQLAPVILKKAINDAIPIPSGRLILVNIPFVQKKFFMSLLGEVPSNVLIGAITTGPILVLYSNIESLSAKDLLKYFCEKTGAKGGGNPKQAQGTVKGIENPLDILKNIIIEKTLNSSN